MIPERSLHRQVAHLVADLREQVVRDTGLRAELRQEHAEAEAARRVAGGFEGWLADVLDQAAVAWVLSGVLVRFCEDNRLVEPVWIGGPERHAPVERAVQARQKHVIKNPLHNDRHWLRVAFGYLRGLRPTARIFNGHNPVWRFGISGPAAEALSDFFRQGEGYASLREPELDTRWLGQLYEELSVHARETYALRQTPEFVEEFILDRTFEPAVAEFGLADTSVVDPSCGSGHFLLGAFHRLVARWRRQEPATAVEVLVERALGQVTGVDVNPFAVAIARFRLLVAALKVCDRPSLERAPGFPTRVATGDSLLPWGEQDAKSIEQPTLTGEPMFAYATEDADLLVDYLRPNRYTVVVGNPPYITVADPARNGRYRELYPEVCYRQYALTVPFAQRFFDLARRGDHDGDGAGWVAQITANSFMKREFGKKLVNDYLAHRVELSEVIDTSGAYIPGHGTPTVILVGRNRLVSPRYSGPIRTVLGIRGEPAQPDEPAEGRVWSAIEAQIDHPGTDSDWISVTDLARDQLARHPWSLSGGGAVDLMRQIGRTGTERIGEAVSVVGFMALTRADDVYLVGRSLGRRLARDTRVVPFVTGTSVRDHAVSIETTALFPYGEGGESPRIGEAGQRLLWRYRPQLNTRQALSGTQVERGLTWYEYSDFHPVRWSAPTKLAFAVVATHNHFVLDRGGRLLNRHAPVILLPEEASEDDHLRLLGVLNSSTACFWLKQVSQTKAGSGIGRGIQPEGWMERYEFTGTKLEEFPLPAVFPLERSRELDGLAQRLGEVSPAVVAGSGVPTRDRLTAAREEWHAVRARMISLQEELDWQVYRLYGLTDQELTFGEPPPLAFGERAFEIVLSRQIDAGEARTEWFARHGSTPISELPEHWPPGYRDLVRRRIDLIGSDRNIGLIERPECKRRWSTDGWEAMQTRALRDWLLDRLEAPELWGGAPEPLSVAQLADRVRHDEDLRAVLDLWIGHDQHDPVMTIASLVAEEHVPFLSTYRYKPSGLGNRRRWEETWRLQCREDDPPDGETPVAPEVPPKYTSADFARPSYWRNRGKLDVPKERFISYPKAGRDGDPTELLGWAGWDHLAQARALATVYLHRRQQAGWPAHLLLPLLAGLVELEPWLHQWHGDPQPGYPDSPAEFFTGLVDTELAALGADRAALATIRGVPDPS